MSLPKLSFFFLSLQKIKKIKEDEKNDKDFPRTFLLSKLFLLQTCPIGHVPSNMFECRGEALKIEIVGLSHMALKTICAVHLFHVDIGGAIKIVFDSWLFRCFCFFFCCFRKCQKNYDVEMVAEFRCVDESEYQRNDDKCHRLLDCFICVSMYFSDFGRIGAMTKR